MKNTLLFGLATTALLAGATQAQAAIIMIDDFNTQSQNVTVSIPDSDPIIFPITGEGLSGPGASSSILGEYRHLFVEINSATHRGTNAEALVNQEIADIANGRFSVSYDDGIEARTVATWDANGAGLDVDFLNADTNSFLLNVSSIDLTDVLTFTVVGNNGETATLSHSDLGIGNHIFNFDEFAVSGGTYTDIFSDVESIAFQVTGPTALDTSFDSLIAIRNNPDNPTPTPEPAAILGLAFSLGCGLLSKKKK